MLFHARGAGVGAFCAVREIYQPVNVSFGAEEGVDFREGRFEKVVGFDYFEPFVDKSG